MSKRECNDFIWLNSAPAPDKSDHGMAPDAKSDELLGEEHPLLLELASLHQAVAHYQVEANKIAVQLQHQSLEARSTLGALNAIKEENSYLRSELDAYRSSASSEKGSYRDTILAQELTLALRRLSDKLDLTEKELVQKSEELALVEGERDASKNAEENAVEAVVQLRLELDACRSEERDLMNRVKRSEEQRRMADLVVDEYAALVRSLEGRPSIRSSSSSSRRNTTEDSPKNALTSLMYARQGLNKLLQDSNSDTEKLHSEISRLHDALDVANMSLAAERKAASDDRRKLAQAQYELNQLKLDDNVAAKMVSRYMKFSQSSTDVLHHTMENLKARHTSAISNYEARLQRLNERLASEIRQSNHIRRALDELTEDISRETYGRRREISLRLALLGREERLSERLRRWVLKSQEVLQRTSTHEGEAYSEQYNYVFTEARDILLDIDGVSEDDGNTSMSSAARIHAAETAVAMLREELRKETDRRLYFQQQLAVYQPHIAHPTLLTPKLVSANISRPSTPALTSAAISTESRNSSDVPTSDTHCSETEHSSLIVSDSLQEPPPETYSSGDLTTPIIREDVPSNIVQESSSGKGYKCDTSSLDESSARVQASPPSSVNSSAQNEIGVTPIDDASNEVSEGSHLTESRTVIDEAPPAFANSNYDDQSAEIPDSTSIQTSPKIVVTELSDHNTVESLDNTLGVRILFTAPDITTNSLQLEGQEGDPFGMPQDDRSKKQMELNFPITDSTAVRGQMDDILDDSPFTKRSHDFEALLPRLSEVGGRYKEIQQSFRDCHLSLKQLKRSPDEGMSIPDSLKAAIQRLHDYCEDARVELEIRVADEERISKGYQTILTVPGALSDEVNQSELSSQIEAFISGTEPSVRRAQDMLKHKLDDLEHDIACIKRAMHESLSPLLHPEGATQSTEEQPKTPVWPTWTGSLFPSSRPSSPAPSFGAVMTSPRLRRSSSIQRIGDGSPNAPLLSALGLRIPMPVSVHAKQDIPSTPSIPFLRGTPRQYFGLGLRGGILQNAHRSSFSLNHDRLSSPNPDIKAIDLDSDIE